MTLTIRTRIGLLCGTFILFLLLLGSVLLWSLSGVVETFRSSVNISSKIIRQAQLLQQVVIDAETGQRGYIITGKSEFLEPYKNANQKFREIIGDLRDRLADRMRHLQALEEIERLKWKWEGEAGEPEIRLRKLVGESKMSLKKIDELILEGTGKGILDRIRSVVESLELEIKESNKHKELALIVGIGRAIVDSETGQRGFMLTGKDNYLKPYYRGQIAFSNKYPLLTELLQGHQTQLEKLTEIKTLYESWLDKSARPEIEARVAFEKDPRSIEDLADLLGRGRGKAIIDELRRRTRALIENLDNEVNQSLRLSEKKADFFNTLGFILMPACVIISLLLTFLLAHSITKSISTLLESTTILSTGDLSHRIKVQTHDEFGDLGNAFNLMAEKIVSIQDRLLESNKMASLGAMSSGIAHELSQPLGSILLKSQLMPKLIEKGDFERVKTISEDVTNQTLRAKKIMDSLRVFSREDRLVEREKCDMNTIVDNVLTLFLDEFQLQNVNLELMLTKEKTVIFVSPVQVGQVLSNLLTNARDAVENSDPKNIKISTDLVNGNVLLKVSDNGLGISKSAIGKIFEPFFTTKPVGKGTGLGLSLSYSMVKDNGGEITVSSEEGKGTDFVVGFPTMKEGLG